MKEYYNGYTNALKVSGYLPPKSIRETKYNETAVVDLIDTIR